MLILSNLTGALNGSLLSSEIARATLRTILLELPLVGLMVFYDMYMFYHTRFFLVNKLASTRERGLIHLAKK